jgi:3-hydroxyisobutyrate dehydrogenase-like beta-hydroxyacid dehydrogenase
VIGLLHPGQMGAAIGSQLVGAGHTVLWCRAGRSASTVGRADAAGLRGVDTLAELLAECEVVLSICPPAAASDVAAEVAGFGGIYVEANAISPHRMIEISERFSTAVDGSIIGPPPGPDRTARLYLSGRWAAVERVHALFAGTRAEPVALGERIGDASALKMAYGSYNKASHVLAAVSHALAEEYGVGAALRAEAASDGGALAKPNRLPSVAARAWRWAPEMLEAAESWAARGLPPQLATAAAAAMRRWESDKDNLDLGVDEVLRHLRQDVDD